MATGVIEPLGREIIFGYEGAGIVRRGMLHPSLCSCCTKSSFPDLASLCQYLMLGETLE